MRHLIPFVLLLVPALAAAADVTGFTLIDAASNSAIRPLVDGDTIDLDTVGSSLNIRADVDGSVGSVTFALSGAQSRNHSESAAPYALFGDSSGNYNVWSPALGTYTLSASADDGAVHTIDFSVVSDGSDPGPDPDPGASDGDGSIAITGERKRWHKVTLELQGPWASETGSPNPFLDYRMTVVFSNGSLSYTVPGYFATDGNAANTSATSGTVWRAHLRPDTTGTWNYQVAFTAGAAVAVNGGGSAVAPYDGLSGSFTVGETDKSAPDLRGRGRLEYVGEHYLKFAGRTNAGDGDWFLKQGSDSPETLFAYTDFDGPFKSDGHGDEYVKDYDPHLGDWQSGDPTWQNGKGKGLIGAINYLASEGMNAFSFLTMNINGDGKNVFPYLDYNERYRMDVSRLEQWEIVMAHGERQGMYLHFKTQETENDQLLDGGALGTQRKLYYRELIARFGHHLALNWNLGEENTNTDAQRKQFAQYFWDNDPYRHNIVIHTFPPDHDEVYGSMLGSASKLTGTSIQVKDTSFLDLHAVARKWVLESRDAGKKWVVAIDESGGWARGVAEDGSSDDPGHDEARTNGLWGTLMAGGAGNEWYFGWHNTSHDLNAEDFRTRDQWWDQCRHALRFFRDNDIPFWLMDTDNALSNDSNDYVFYRHGQVYVVYLKQGGSTDLDLNGVSGSFTVRWYDPRNGGALQTGSVTSISGGAWRSLGNPPSSSSEDWAILVRSSGSPGNLAPVAQASATPTSGETPLPVQFSSIGSSDSDGSIVAYSWNFGDGSSSTAANPSHTYNAAGTYTATLTVTDDDGASASASVGISVTTAAGEQAPFGGSAPAVPSSGVVRIEAEDYDLGGEGVAYHDTASGNNGGAYRSDGVDIESTTDVGGGHNVGWIAAGEWLEYTIDVATAGTYQVELRVARKPSGSVACHLEVAGNDRSGPISVPSTGGWQLWTTVDAQVDLASGPQVLRLAMDGDQFNVNWLELTRVDDAPTSVVAINAGGGAYTAVDGTAYAADTQVSGGRSASTTAAIAATEDDTLYRSERYGDFTYAIPVPDGDYTLTLQFAEFYWSADGKRVFDVGVEGVEVVTDLDVHATAGGKNIAYDVVIPVSVTDGQLDLVFSTDVDNAKLSALRLESATTVSQ